MIDTHMHLDALGDDGPALVQAAVDRGVRGVVSVGVDPRRSQAIVGALPGGLVVRRVLGLHPQEVRDQADVDDALAALERALDDDACAVGETGLDARPDKGNGALHEEVFRRHLRLARQRDLPVVLHCVRRDGRLLEILDDESGGRPWRGVGHGFTGSRDTRLLAVKRGVASSVGFQVLDGGARGDDYVAAVSHVLRWNCFGGSGEADGAFQLGAGLYGSDV